MALRNNAGLYEACVVGGVVGLMLLLIASLFLAFNFSFSLRRDVVQLNNDNWHLINEGEWIIKFYAPWCPACKKFEKVWTDLFQSVQENGKIVRFGEVNVEEEYMLTMRFFIMSLPTVVHAKDGKFRFYQGPNNLNSLFSFLIDETWTTIAPLPWYKSPTSPTISFIVKFALITKKIMDIYDKFIKEHNYPGWAVIVVALLFVIGASTLISLAIAHVLLFIFGLFSRSAPQKRDEDQKKVSPEELATEDKEMPKKGTRKRVTQRE